METGDKLLVFSVTNYTMTILKNGTFLDFEFPLSGNYDIKKYGIFRKTYNFEVKNGQLLEKMRNQIAHFWHIL